MAKQLTTSIFAGFAKGIAEGMIQGREMKARAKEAERNREFQKGLLETKAALDMQADEKKLQFQEVEAAKNREFQVEFAELKNQFDIDGDKRKFNQQLSLLSAKADSVKKSISDASAKTKIELTESAKKRLNGTLEEQKIMVEQSNKILSLIELQKSDASGQGAADFATVSLLARLADPRTGVRESERAALVSSLGGGIPAEFERALKKIALKETLLDSDRKAVGNIAKTLGSVAQQRITEATSNTIEGLRQKTKGTSFEFKDDDFKEIAQEMPTFFGGAREKTKSIRKRFLQALIMGIPLEAEEGTVGPKTKQVLTEGAPIGKTTFVGDRGEVEVTGGAKRGQNILSGFTAPDFSRLIGNFSQPSQGQPLGPNAGPQPQDAQQVSPLDNITTEELKKALATRLSGQ